MFNSIWEIIEKIMEANLSSMVCFLVYTLVYIFLYLLSLIDFYWYAVLSQGFGVMEIFAVEHVIYCIV